MNTNHPFDRAFGVIVSTAAFVAIVCAPAWGASKGDLDYGAEQVGGGTVFEGGKDLAPHMGEADHFNYLALKNHSGPSGVPLGGVGVGYFCYAPDGAFTRIGINDWQDEGDSKNTPIIQDTRGTFLAMWDKDGARLLQRGEGKYLGMDHAQNTVYRGLFPIAENAIDDDVTVRAWSGVTPQDVKDSSLPCAWIEVTLRNPTASPREMAAAFSWEDVIGRRLCDIRDLARFHALKNPQSVSGHRAYKGSGWYDWMPRVPTQAANYEAAGFRGLRQFSAPLHPVVWMMQNYNNEIALLAQTAPDAQITFLPSYEVDGGEEAWTTFRASGEFPNAGSSPTTLYDPASAKEKASAIAVKVQVPAQGEKTVRFLVAWFSPQIKIDPRHDDPLSHYGDTDYNHYYQKYFNDLDSLIGYAAQNRERIYQETKAWQEPILASSYPDWLKFMVINSGYVLYTNGVLNMQDDFVSMEGAMGGLSGTMDQRIASHPFTQKFFTELDRSEMSLFGRNPGPDGQMLHFDGLYYLGLDAHAGGHPLNAGWMVDNSGSWLIQLAKEYQQTGDKAWVEQFRDEIPRAVKFLYAQIKGPYFFPEGQTTFDHYWHPKAFNFTAGNWPTYLKASAILYRALGDEKSADQCEADSKRASEEYVRTMWNGQFFSYGVDDQGRRMDDAMFNGQLAGQFLSRYCGWGDTVPFEDARISLATQMKTNVGQVPDYYAPRPWLVKENRPMPDPTRPAAPKYFYIFSPFYMENYVGMAAIQAGMIHDGLEVIKGMQIVNLRNGWTWSQCIWKPKALTYMSAPVTWFITDVLAGAAFDANAQELTLGPVNLTGKDSFPLYYPTFWAQLENDVHAGKTQLRILKTFGDKERVIAHLRIEPNGRPTSEAKVVDVGPFVIKEGAILDLSAYSPALNAGNMAPPPSAEKMIVRENHS